MSVPSSEISFKDIQRLDVSATARLREETLEAAAKSRTVQQQLTEICEHDPCFWVNMFVFTYSPKDCPDNPVIPFVLYPFQVDVLNKILEVSGKEDLLIEKSRDMGASWLCLIAFYWKWLYQRHQTILLVSRTEALVDKRGETDSLFWKLDHITEHLPRWMVPVDSYRRQKLLLFNKKTKSTITGASTTGDVSRGGRKTVIFKDEFAAVEDGYSMNKASQQATNCRIVNSTPRGTGNAFADLAAKIDPSRKLTLHWSVHPIKSAGMYQYKDGKLNILRGARRKNYPYILDGRLRSPWYDRECARAISDQEIAQEIDIDYARSGWQFFPPDMIEKLKENATVPNLRADVVGADQNARIRQIEKGPLAVWCPLDAEGIPPRSRYAIGCDVSLGTGGLQSSESVASVFDIDRQFKVAEYSTRNQRPDEFADTVIGLCWLFRGKEKPAYLIWEANGPGAAFTKQVERRGYKYHYNRPLQKGSRVARHSNVRASGWWTGKDSKRQLLSDYGRALRTGEYINPSAKALSQLEQYVHLPTGDIVHSKANGAYDPTERGENHGDVVIADALSWHGSEDLPGRKKIEQKKEVSNNSVAGRMLHRKRVREALLAP